MKKIIVISAHPDDEILGAGGTLLKHKACKDEIYWLIITKVSTDHGFSSERVQSRQNEIRQVAERLEIIKTYTLDYPTMSLTSDSLIKLVPEISEIFSEVQPEVVYCVNRSDAHSDHRIVFDAVAACTKSFRYPYVKKFYMYECISETEFAPQLHEKQFIPNHFVDVSRYMDEKIELMEIYESEIGDHPFPRSAKNIYALATFRGATAGVEYAEAFQIVKSIEK